jgi:hypothetical protein
MVERNESRYQLEQDNQIYILATSLVGNKIKLFCQDSAQIYEGLFAMTDLIKISQYFQPNHQIDQIQMYLNGIIEKQRVGINRSGASLIIVLYLINGDQIKIPLMQKLANNNFNNFQNFNNTQPALSNQFIQPNPQGSGVAPPPQFLVNQNIQQQQQYLYKNNLNVNQQQYLNMKRNQSQPQYTLNNIQKFAEAEQGGEDNVNGIKPITGTPVINPNQLASSPNGLPFPQADALHTNYNYQLDINKIGKLEENTNIIKAEQEKLRNDMKRVLEEASKYKEQNQQYKAEHDTIIQENEELKNELEKYKQEIVTFQNENKALQEENDSLRNQVTLLNKDVDAFESQNDEIRKMYAELENENANYKNQIQEYIKENETLRGQVQELNNNFTLINGELENIKKESNLFKTNIEKQRNNMNEEVIKKLVEENNLYKKQSQENILLKKQIEDLQYQLQMNQRQVSQEKTPDEEEDPDGENEVKGDIIHNLNELEMLTKKINKDNDKKIIINLLYKASVDGDRALAFHEKCDNAQNTIVLIETKKGKRFGGFTTCSWSGNCVDKNDPKSFIFSFDKMQTYDNIPGDEAIGCYPKFGPIFLGCQIKIFDNAFTKGGTTFEKELNFNTQEDYELTGGERSFEVKDIEVYEVIIE